MKQTPLLTAGSFRSSLIAIAIILLTSYYTYAEEYSFSVPSAHMENAILADGGDAIEYTMEFQNTPNGHPIDIVDVGMPTAGYSIDNMEAYLDGQRVTGVIRPSQYVKPGVEVHLDQFTIPAGGHGTFRFHAIIPDLVYQDTTRKDYASFQITPTWFGEQYVVGNTALKILVILPAGIQPEEVLDQGLAFTSKETVDGRVVAGWDAETRFTSVYKVGLSFPKRVMNHVVSMSIGQMLVNWYKSALSPQARLFLGLAGAAAFGFIFFRFTGGTGGCLFVPLLVIGFIVIATHELAQILMWPVLLVLGILVESARRRRKSKYLPAILTIEGGGIKRGMTAPEAAVLLELPINKVVTMILFGMLKKGFIRQTSTEPPGFVKSPKPPEDAILQSYEREALALINGKPMNQIDFGPLIKNLINSVAIKMRGFDVSDTKEYYKQIISRAWTEAKAIGDVETWQKTMDEKIDWMILDPNFDTRFRPYGTRYIPRSYRTSGSTGSFGIPSQTGGGSSTASAPRFSDVAASVSGWLQNTAGGVVAKIEGKPGGLINLGAVDKAMGQALKSSGSGHSGGGGGGGCACACAGCACACACAGGGR